LPQKEAMVPFKLVIGICPSEKDFISSIPKGEWARIKTEAYGDGSRGCAGCGHSPSEALELDFHIEECKMGDPHSATVVMLCRACHAIRHFDMAAENGWVTLVNSIHSQETLVSICRDGRSRLIAEINANNIIILKNKNAKEYARQIKEEHIRHNDKIRVIFGKNFDWTPRVSAKSPITTESPKTT
jgi:hypothetical protein